MRRAETLDRTRERTGREPDSLAEEILAIDRAKRDYPLALGDALRDHRNKVQTHIERAAPAGRRLPEPYRTNQNDSIRP